jgi:hypothetical protein
MGVAALMAVASAAALIQPSLYRDNPLVAAGWRGNDLVTLLIAVPALMLAARLARRGSARAQLILMGILAYAAYNFAFYLFGTVLNPLFLVYAGVLALSLLALGFSAFALDPAALELGPARQRQRVVAAFILAVVLALGGFWLGVSLHAAITGRVPAMVSATGSYTNLVAALDLAVIVPTGILAAIWLWKQRKGGYVLGTIWTVQGAIYMSALTAATVSGALAGQIPIQQAALWGVIAVGCLTSSCLLLRRGHRSDEVIGR